MSNPFIAALRTIVQAAVGLGVAAAGNLVLGTLGVELDVPALTEALSLLTVGLVVYGVNQLGAAFPVINQIVSLGLANGTAVYESE